VKFTVKFGKSTTNYHGTQEKGKAWNKETVRGWKLRCVDLLQPIKGHGKTRAKWYKRFILYFPSGSWWNLDVALVSR
jgi:hypothetical protein